DLIHAHWILPQGFVAATTGPRPARRVLTVHGGDVFGLRGRILDAFSRYALCHSDQVTVNSSATEAAVRRIADRRATIARIPIGVGLSRRPRGDVVRSVRQRYGVGAGPLLVFVGRVVEEKGVEDIVHAVARLTPGLPDVSAVIAGTGQ